MQNEIVENQNRGQSENTMKVEICWPAEIVLWNDFVNDTMDNKIEGKFEKR